MIFAAAMVQPCLICFIKGTLIMLMIHKNKKQKNTQLISTYHTYNLAHQPTTFRLV